MTTIPALCLENYSFALDSIETETETETETAKAKAKTKAKTKAKVKATKRKSTNTKKRKVLGVRPISSLDKKEYDLYKALVQFFKENPLVSSIVEPLSRKKKTKGLPSLRVINILVTKYAPEKGVRYLLTEKGDILDFNDKEAWKPGNTVVDVAVSYNRHLAHWKKGLFAPFKREFRILFPRGDGTMFETTLCQMNFMRWAIKHKVIDYCSTHRKSIEEYLLLNKPTTDDDEEDEEEKEEEDSWEATVVQRKRKRVIEEEKTKTKTKTKRRRSKSSRSPSAVLYTMKTRITPVLLVKPRHERLMSQQSTPDFIVANVAQDKESTETQEKPQDSE